MTVTQHPIKGNPVVVLDVVGGRYRIATHSLPELLVDTRRTHNKSVLPKVEVSEDKIQIGKQPLMRWFTTKLGVEARIVVPEDLEITVRMFSGELVLNGRYRKINVRMRSGNVTLEGPYFECREIGEVKITTGNLRCHKLSEAGYGIPWTSDKVKYIENNDGVQIRIQLNMGELDFS